MNNNSDIFKKNIEALKKVNLKLAKQLEGITKASKFSIVVESDLSGDINIINNETLKSMFIGKPSKDIITEIKSLQIYALYKYLYFYGFSSGFLVNLLIHEFKSLRRIVVIEPEIEIIFIVLGMFDFSNKIENHNIEIYLSNQVDFSLANSIFIDKDVKIYSKTYNLYINSDYYNDYEEDIIKINQTFIRAIEHSVYSAGNDATDSLIGFENFINNLKDICNNSYTTDFVNSIKVSDLAILVATGPSLQKQLPMLKEIQDYVTIFSVDASLPILEQWGIQADVVASIERVDLTARFYEATSKEYLKNTSIMLSAVVTKKLLESAKVHKNLAISLRPFGYMKYFGIDKFGYLGVGMSSANLLYELAFLSRHKKIVLIGQDLAYGEDGLSHSKGAIFGESEIQYRDDDLYVPAYGSKGEIRTTRIWKMFLNYFERDIFQVNDICTTINATEGGAHINGTIEEPFINIVKKILKTKPQKKKKIVVKKISKEDKKREYDIALKKLKEMLAYAMDIKERVDRTSDKLNKLFNIDNKADIKDKQLDKMITKIENIKSIFAEKEFQLIFFDIVQSYITAQELELVLIQVRYCQNEEELKNKKLEWTENHKIWLLSLSAGIDTMIKIILNSNTYKDIK